MMTGRPFNFRHQLLSAEKERLQNTVGRKGRLVNLDSLCPRLPSHNEWVAAPSTWRVHVHELVPANVCERESEEERAARENREGELRWRLQNGSRKHALDSSTSVRCFARFKCTNCTRIFNKNTLHLEKIFDGCFVDPNTMEKPFEQCAICQGKCETEKIEPFDHFKAEQRSFNDHNPEYCPECIKQGTWCSSARRLSKRTPKQFDKSLMGLEGLTNKPKWQKSRAGTGIEVTLHLGGYEYHVELVPSLFCFPTGKQKLVVRKSIEAGLLLHNKAPKSIDTFGDILTAINFIARKNLAGLEEGAWYNSIVESFLLQDGAQELPAGTMEGFRCFPVPADHDCADWDIGYHGTSLASAGKIFFEGGLKKPGEGARIAHGQCGSKTRQTIYTSPALEVAAHPVYSEFFTLQPTPTKTKKRHRESFAQIVFEVRVGPGYHIQPNTLARRRHWPAELRIDPRFHTFSDLEWLTENSASVKLSAILVRQFGGQASPLPSPYNGLASRVRIDHNSHEFGDKGPEFHWTDLRVQAHKNNKLAVSKANHTAYVKDKEGRVIISLPAVRLPSGAFRFVFENLRVEIAQLSDSLDANSLGNILLRKHPNFVASVNRMYPVRKTGNLCSITTEGPPQASKRSSTPTPFPNLSETTVPRIFLGVEESKINLVEESGYFAIKRRNIAVSDSPGAAREGCLKWHPDDRAVVFEVLSRHLTDDISVFTNRRGSLRLNTRHVPAICLQKMSSF